MLCMPASLKCLYSLCHLMTLFFKRSCTISLNVLPILLCNIDTTDNHANTSVIFQMGQGKVDGMVGTLPSKIVTDYMLYHCVDSFYFMNITEQINKYIMNEF